MPPMCLPSSNLETPELRTHPASTTHSKLNRRSVGRSITDGLIRLSVGLEHVDDIKEDLFNALEAL